MVTQALRPVLPRRASTATGAYGRGEAPDGYRKTTLENGIQVVTEALPATRSVALGIVVDTGPRDEAPDQHGLAHLTEHLMFQGTASHDALTIARLIDEAGGQLGAYTGRDYTCYYASVVDDYQTYVVDLLGEMLLNSTFPPESVARQKQAIIRELSGHFDTPSHRAEALMRAAAWRDHPLGRPIEGGPASVSRLEREDVIYFAHENYLPNRIIIAASGHVDHDDFTAQVRDSFWRLMGEGPPAEDRPSRFQPGVVVEHAATSQVYFSLGIEAGSFTCADRYALHLFSNLLGGGMSSRLFRRVREEQGLAYDIHCDYLAYREGGLLVIEGAAAPEHLLPVLDCTWSELSRLIDWDEPIDEEELWKAKMQMRGQHLLSSEHSNTRMSRLATQEFYFGRQVPTEEVLGQIDAMDCSTLERLARGRLAQSLTRPALAVVGPNAEERDSAAALRRLLGFGPAASDELEPGISYTTRRTML